MPRGRGEPPAVRVYTVCDESRYLVVKNVPALGCGDELAKLFGSYGEIEECKPMDAEDSGPFTDIYWIKFSKVSNARFAKRKLDDFVFYGNQLQVSYAPQFESLLDTKDKLEGRRKEVLARIKSGKSEGSSELHGNSSFTHSLETGATYATNSFSDQTSLKKRARRRGLSFASPFLLLMAEVIQVKEDVTSIIEDLKAPSNWNQHHVLCLQQ